MANPYFNATYYLANNPDIFAAGVTTATAWDHYVSYGAQEAYTAGGMTRAPNAWFDAQFYLQNNQDLIGAGVTPESALDHFTNFGMYELRAPSQSVAASPMTDASLLAYVNANADVAEALGVTVPATELTEAQQNGAIANFYGYGYAENRPAAPTNVDPNPSGTFTLTAGADTATANKFSSTDAEANFNFVSTLNSADVLTGSGDNPTLTVVADRAAVNATPTMTGIETLDASAYSAITLVGNSITGLKAINNNSSTNAFSATNLQSKLETVSLNNVGSSTTITVANAALSGAEDKVAVTLNGSLSGSTLSIGSVSGTNGYETISVASTGEANTVNRIISNNTKTIEFSGDQNLNVRGASTVVVPAGNTGDAAVAALSNQFTAIDASAVTGNLTIGGVALDVKDSANADQKVSSAFAASATAKGSVKITGGEGDDAFYISDLGEKYVINGGEGKNALHITSLAGTWNTDPTAVTTAAAISNIQVLRAVQGDGDGLAANLGVNLLGTTGITELQHAKAGATAAAITLTNLTHTDGFTINAVGNKAVGAQNFNGVTYNALGVTGSSDKVAITVGNQGQEVGTGLVTLGAQTLANIENVSLKLSDMSSTSTFATSITATSLKNFEFTTNAGKVDAGSINLTGPAGTTKIGGSNTVTTAKIVSDGGVTAIFDNAAGASIELSGAGKHVITADNTANTNSVTINASATTGGVTITGENGADTLVGGSGNDTITGGAGADVMTGGSGADIFVIDSTGVAAATDADVVTDFRLSQSDKLEFGNAAGTATNYAEGAAPVLNYAAALAAANVQLVGGILYSAQQVGSDTYVFFDAGSAGAASEVVQLTGVTLADIDFNAIA